jgi:predicted RNA-binding protein with TRAM domain
MGKEYEVDITELSRRGDAGVARIEGFVIFVANTKPKDHVKITITKIGNGYATGEVVKSGESAESGESTTPEAPIAPATTETTEE